MKTNILSPMKHLLSASRPRKVISLLAGLALVIPGVAVAETICIEFVFGGTKWSPRFSEETAGWQNLNGIMTGAWFYGSYSDDLEVESRGLAYGYSFGTESAEIITSEELPRAVCPQDTWVTSIRTSGKYSDNVHIKCSSVWTGGTKLKYSSKMAIANLGPYSEEAWLNVFMCPPAMGVVGVGCKKSYCDEMFFDCRAMTK